MSLASAMPAPFGEFRYTVANRLSQLADESGKQVFSMPVGIFLVIDQAHGGDATAEELKKRFGLLDAESRNVLDFYFLGWRLWPNQPNIEFDLDDFTRCRSALRKSGIGKFGGNADLILVDATYDNGDSKLRFDEAIRVDLAAGAKNNDFPTLGGFLESIIEAAEQVRNDDQASERGLAFSISDRMGLAIATTSILDFFLETWEKVIGAKKLQHLAVRHLGPVVNLRDWS